MSSRTTYFCDYCNSDRDIQHPEDEGHAICHDDGHAATVCADLARGDQQVADLRYARDVAQGVLDAAQQAAWRLSADRRTIDGLTRWSMSRELADHGQPDERLAWTGPKAVA